MECSTCMFVSLLAYLSTASAYHICGEESFVFDPNEQTCCGGRIHLTPVALGVDFRCCGDDVYPLDGTWECCGNIKMDVREDTMCCNNEIINSTTHECCGDRYTFQLKHKKQQGHECCGTSYYNKDVQTCCSNENFYGVPMHVADGVGSCCGSQTYDAASEICCPLSTGGMQSHSVGELGVMLQETECCGAGWINKTTHICCQNVAQPRGNGTTSCYGTQAYNPSRQVICDGELQDIQDGKTKCCNGKLINPNEKPCCNNPDLLEQSPFSCCGYEWSRDIYDPTESSCMEGSRIKFPEVSVRSKLWERCGEITFASTLYICCSGQLAPKFADSMCCGTKPYRYNNEICVSETESIVVDKITPNAKICTTTGRDIDLQYDPETQTCCREPQLSHNWRVFNGTEAEGECCLLSHTEVIFTDLTSQTCCKVNDHQKVHEIPKGKGECCGPEMLIKGEQLCDKDMGEVVDIPENHPTHNDVCVPKEREHNNIRQTYDNRREFCSYNGEIIPKAEHKDLCGGQIYDTTTHSCCGLIIHRLVTHQCCEDYIQPKVNDEGLPLECCGMQAYHSGTSTCFHGYVLDNIPQTNARYCGSVVYDNSQYDCVDGGELVPQEAGPYIRLCGSTGKAYDNRLQECCGEDLIGAGETCCLGYTYETPGTSLRGGECCGAIGYNPSTHSCCLGSISHIYGMVEPACCMRQAYDRNVSDINCCGGKLSRKAPGETECSVADGIVHRPDEIVCNGVRHPAGHMQCCGSDLYDPTRELCCDGFRYEAEEGRVCCGNKPYQNTSNGSHLCCDGTLHTQAEGKECCNRAAFYPSTHQCFTTGGQNVIVKLSDNTPSATDAFCTEGSYDPTNQTCCDGLLYNGLRECCGNQVIDALSDSMCCNAVIRLRIYGNASQCCPSGLIMHESRGCDAHQPDFWYQVCNDTKYFPLTQGCCAGIVYSLHNAQCRDDKIFFLCGDEFYTQENHTCCNDSLTDIPNGECCETTAFDPTSSICCEGNVRRIHRGRDQCCGVLAFDVKREMCCESGPVRMPRSNRRIQSKMENGFCCGEGFEPNFQTRYCEAVPLLCMGLEPGNLWKEASDDCSKDLTFSFNARHIDMNDTHTIIMMDIVHHLLPHNSNVHLDTLVLPSDTNCRKLSEGETYVALSSGDIEDSSLLLRNEDFLGKYHNRIASKLLRRTCS